MNQRIIYAAVFIGLLVTGITGCKKIAGLDLQEDVDHETSTLDPHINKTAWQYLKERSILNQPDTIFKRMYDAIIYSGIDTAEYMKEGRTFIFLHNDAVFRSGNPADSYFGRYKVNNVAATRWSNYTPQQVKNWLLYLIGTDAYSFENLNDQNIQMNTLLPAGVDAANPQSIMGSMIRGKFSGLFHVMR